MKQLTFTLSVKDWRVVAIACSANSRDRTRAREYNLADDLIRIAQMIAQETGKYDIKGEPK